MSCPRNTRYLLRSNGRRRGGPSRTGVEGAYLNPYVTDEQRSRRPIFIATLWAGAVGCFPRCSLDPMIQIWALRSRLENSQLTSRNTSYFDGALSESLASSSKSTLKPMTRWCGNAWRRFRRSWFQSKPNGDLC